MLFAGVSQRRFCGSRTIGIGYALAAMFLTVVPVESADIPPADMALFEAFKTFCVDTGAEPQAVKTAVESAGGRPRGVPGVTDTPFPMTTASWDLTLLGRPLLVSAGSGYPSRALKTANNPPPDSDDCIVHSFANADSSVTAIRDWVGVPQERESTGSRFTPDLTQHYYSYQVAGSTRAAIADQIERRSADVEGRSWALVLLRTPQSASVQLTHTLPNLNAQ